MANRITGQLTQGSQHSSGCVCAWPCCVAVFDEIITPSLKTRPGRMVVDRWFDCLLCGPWVHRLEMPIRPRPDGNPVRKGTTLALDYREQEGVVYPWST